MLSYLQQEDPQDKQLENKKRSDSFPNIQGFFLAPCIIGSSYGILDAVNN